MALNINDLAQWATLMGLGVAAVTLSYNAGTYTQDIDNKIQSIESNVDENARSIDTKVSAVNSRFDAIGAVDEKTLNNKIAKNGIVISRIQTDLATVQQTTSEIAKIRAGLDLVVEQVKTLEGGSTSASKANQSSTAIKEINNKIAALEKQIQTIGTRGLNASAKIEIQSDYTAQIETQTGNNFEISNLGCVRKSAIVECSLISKNFTQKNWTLHFYTGNSSNSEPTRAFGTDGIPIYSASVRHGNGQNRNSLSFDFPPDIPSKVLYTFRNVPKELSGFLRIEFNIGGDYVAFRNVAIQ